MLRFDSNNSSLCLSTASGVTDHRDPMSQIINPLSNTVLPHNNETNKLSILLTNARSLSPKIESLIDIFQELDIMAGIITESWFQDSKNELDFEKGTGLNMIVKNRSFKRKVTRCNKPKKGGEVAIIYNTSMIKLLSLIHI